MKNVVLACIYSWIKISIQKHNNSLATNVLTCLCANLILSLSFEKLEVHSEMTQIIAFESFCIWNVYWKFGLSLFVLNLKWVFALLLRSANPLKVNLRIFKQAVDVFFACGLTPCHVLFSIDSTLLSSNQKRRQNTMNVWTMSFDLYFFYIFSDKLFSNNSFDSLQVWIFNSFVWKHWS